MEMKSVLYRVGKFVIYASPDRATASERMI
jgi:hypothetical protein